MINNSLQLVQKNSQLTTAMMTSVRILQMTNLQLFDYIQEIGKDNVLIDLDQFDDQKKSLNSDLEFDYFSFDKHHSSTLKDTPDQSTNNTDKDQFMYDKEENSSGISDIKLQISALCLPREEQLMMNCLVFSLTEQGFLEETAEEMSQWTHRSPEFIQKCIDILRTLEPAGIGAHDLQECLHLQLKRMPEDTSLAERIIDEYIMELSRKQFGIIAKKCKTSEANVIKAFEQIKKINPNPLNGYSSASYTNYIIPDIYIEQEDDHFKCILNERYIPKIVIDPSYKSMLDESDIDNDTRNYLSKCNTQINDITRYIAYRKSTLQMVMEYILNHQMDFFKNGPGNRIAMSNQEIAVELGLHESTISRAVSGKYFQCSWGVFPLKSLFSHSIRTTDAVTQVDYDKILNEIKKMIDEETAENVLNDKQISGLLQDNGIMISRRTVAKYRQILDIPIASKRRAMLIHSNAKTAIPQ